MALALIYVAVLAFVPYLVAIWRAPRWEWRRVRWLVVGVAVLARIALLPVPPVLSEDAYRYLWEGKVQAAGFNPYKFAPDAPQLAHLRDATWEQLKHREVPSVYPPVLLVVFRFGAAVSSSPHIFKLIFTAFDLATLWFIVRLLRVRGQTESLALVWAWNPLVVLEFAGNGHEMSLPICFFVAGLWSLERKRSVPAAAAFAVATLSHLMALPVVLIAMLAARVKNARAWLAFGAVLVLGFLPFVGAGRALPLGLLDVAGRWLFNGSIFELLVRWFDNDSARQVYGWIWVLHERPKRIATVLLAVVFVWTLLRRYAPSRAVLTVAGGLLLLSPVVHPWYATWLVALMCFAFRLSWLAFSALVLVSYVAKLTELETGMWVDTALVRWIEYAPFFALLAYEWCRKRFDSARDAG
jgi:hypothetical protein